MAVKDVTSVNVTRTFKLVVEQLPLLILYLSKKKFLLPLWNFKEKTFWKHLFSAYLLNEWFVSPHLLTTLTSTEILTAVGYAEVGTKALVMKVSRKGQLCSRTSHNSIWFDYKSKALCGRRSSNVILTDLFSP